MHSSEHADLPVTDAGAAAPLRYDRTTIVLHWLTAGLVALLWSLGQTIDFFSRGAPRTAARSVHILLGVTMALLIVARLTWRIRRGRRLPAADSGIIGRAATVTHWALYALLAVTVLLGISNAWIRGDSIFGLFTIPSLAPGDKELRTLVEDLHGYSANTVLIVAGVHAVAGLVHHFLLRDGVLRRMLAGGR